MKVWVIDLDGLYRRIKEVGLNYVIPSRKPTGIWVSKPFTLFIGSMVQSLTQNYINLLHCEATVYRVNLTGDIRSLWRSQKDRQADNVFRSS